MNATIDVVAFDRGTDRILSFFTAEQARRIVQYCGETDLLDRIDELAGKANEGELTVKEKAEYQGYLRANKFLAILQAKARKFLTTMQD